MIPFLIIFIIASSVTQLKGLDPCEDKNRIQCETKIKDENNHYYRYGNGAKGKP